MNDGFIIHNTGYAIFLFYAEKILSLGAASVSGLFSYLNFYEDGLSSILFFILSLTLLFFSDIVAMPIEKKGSIFRFHHLWRTSKIDVEKVRFLWMNENVRFKSMNIFEQKQLFIIGRRFNIYYVVCDRKNNLAELLDTYQTS